MANTFIVGTHTQFSHSEVDPQGNAIPPQAGSWSVSNPAVASITIDGLASWNAPGQTLVLYVIQAYQKFGALQATVHAASVVSLTASPATVTLYPGSLARITIHAFDVHGNPVLDFDLTSMVSSDYSVADIIQIDRVGLDAPQFLVVGVSPGTCQVTAFVGTASVALNADVLNIGIPTGLSQAEADARYRQLGVVIPDSEVSKVPRVDKPDASGAVTYTWLRTERAMHFKLVGDLTATIVGLPVGEFMYFDVDTGAGGHALSFVPGGGLPVIEPDDNVVPVISQGANLQDSFMLYHEGPRLALSRTWKGIPTT